jgi:GNAT superfamily N-acetyltransferase
MSDPFIREAKPGEESAIHEAHMRSIREICVKDHGKDEIRGWGNRPLGDRWKEAIKNGVWVVEYKGVIHGHGYIRIYEEGNEKKAHIHGLYLTPEVSRKGLGIILVKLMLDKARNAGVKSVTLDSTITAHKFYMRQGFRDGGPMQRREIGGYLVTGFPMILDFD